MNRLRSNARDDSNEGQKVPRWLPITLLTVTTAALTIPAVLLWKQKKALGQNSPLTLARKQASSVPPARRRPLNAAFETQAGTKPQPGPSSRSIPNSSPPPPRRVSIQSSPSISQLSSRQTSATFMSKDVRWGDSISLFDGPLLSLCAFGIATATVGVGAALAVLGVQKALGVNNVEEFAIRMRQLFSSHLPEVSRRLYRSSSEIGHEGSSDVHDNTTQQSVKSPGEWSWDAAENRLREAFDRGGVVEWATCAVRELKAEEELERRKRGL